MIGWPGINNAVPNPAHLSLARMEGSGLVRYLITQNVDCLHRKAGSKRVLDLHGNLEKVICTACGYKISREIIQQYLHSENTDHELVFHAPAPDGDVILDNVDYDSFNIPVCEKCGGILKPDVVFFGESVPKDRVNRVMEMLNEAHGLLIVGSSLMVFSGFRFVRAAVSRKIPVAAINLGKTRADPLLDLKCERPCGPALQWLVRKTISENTMPFSIGFQA